jgi:hypothetical protein
VTLFVFCLILFSETCSVTGQIFFKHAMSGCVGSGKARRSLNLAAGCPRNEGRFLYMANALAAVWLGIILICFGTMLVSATFAKRV